MTSYKVTMEEVTMEDVIIDDVTIGEMCKYLFLNSYKYISLIHTNTFSFCINDLLKTTPCTALQKEQQGATFRIRNAFLSFFFIFANINFLGGFRFFLDQIFFKKNLTS